MIQYAEHVDYTPRSKTPSSKQEKKYTEKSSKLEHGLRRILLCLEQRYHHGPGFFQVELLMFFAGNIYSTPYYTELSYIWFCQENDDELW